MLVHKARAERVQVCVHSALALLTVARFLTCLMMWEILRALFDASLSSGIVMPDASIVMWGLGGSAQPAFRSAALQSRHTGVSVQ